ncbi:MAG TPA: T9SS type A sorting domain-containing protein [Saprospiraceae bacterium]|nr:T9SS type A sorting domain-containing protein [Saprospiraceae bacterium]
MKILFAILSIVACCINLHGQSFFNIQPDVGGNDMQGVCRAIILKDSTFHILGHRYDTAGAGSNVKPWLGEFNYDGDLTSLFPLVDSLYDTPFYPGKILYAQKTDNIYYVYSVRLVESPYYTPYLFELNISTGQVLKSKLLSNSDYPDFINAPASILFDNDIITLCNYIKLEDSIKMFITNLDTLFNELSLIEVKSNIKVQFPKYLRKTIKNGFEIVAIQEFNPGTEDFNYSFVYFEIDSSGIVLNYKIAPTSVSISNNLYVSNCVLVNSQGDWVLYGDHSTFYPDTCMFCSIDRPYLFSVSTDFNSLLWETRFFDVPDLIEPYYDVYSITAVDDGFIATASFRNFSLTKFPDSGVLLKAALNGDSLWMKHYIPLDWDEYRVVWTSLKDIKTTPFGTIIAAGEISDRDLMIIRPWILHLDKDGCLVPGCNLVGTEDETKNNALSDVFKIFPNPATDEIYLLSTKSFTESVNIRIVSNSGTIIKERNFFPISGYQYSLPIEDIPAGIYYLILSDDNGIQSESHKFVKQ